MNMKLKAEEFNKSPAQAYRAADKGERVEITHTRYPGITFILTPNSVLLLPKENSSDVVVTEKYTAYTVSKDEFDEWVLFKESKK